jgi:integrase
MSIRFDPDRGKFVVRWWDDGKRRCRRFDSESDAMAFEAVLGGLPSQGTQGPEVDLATRALEARIAKLEARRPDGTRGGVYAYATTEGIRWRFVFRQSDGTLSSRRGFTSRKAAATARRKLVESIDRGEVKVTRQTFGSFWDGFVAERRPYMTPGSHRDLIVHGRKRIVPFFGDDPLAKIDEERVREWLATMIEVVEADEIAPKTVNNARTCLSVALNEAVRRGLIPRNPCAHVPALPLERREIDYLRLAEIGPYLDACGQHYRALAEFLIGTGARVSEAVATRWPDLDLEQGAVRIYRQRARDSHGTRVTKGKRFRSVQIGPRLAETLRSSHADRLRAGVDDGGWIFLCPAPRRGRYARRTEPVPPHRKTVHEWHEAALTDAGVRDMPLHSLRHTAAAAWLAVGHPLIFVQRQLGHRSITTTEEHYGHLEISFVRGAAAQTEQAIADAQGIVRVA